MEDSEHNEAVEGQEGPKHGNAAAVPAAGNCGRRERPGRLRRDSGVAKSYAAAASTSGSALCGCVEDYEGKAKTPNATAPKDATTISAFSALKSKKGGVELRFKAGGAAKGKAGGSAKKATGTKRKSPAAAAPTGPLPSLEDPRAELNKKNEAPKKMMKKRKSDVGPEHGNAVGRKRKEERTPRKAVAAAAAAADSANDKSSATESGKKNRKTPQSGQEEVLDSERKKKKKKVRLSTFPTGEGEEMETVSFDDDRLYASTADNSFAGSFHASTDINQMDGNGDKKITAIEESLGISTVIAIPNNSNLNLQDDSDDDDPNGDGDDHDDDSNDDAGDADEYCSVRCVCQKKDIGKLTNTSSCSPREEYIIEGCISQEGHFDENWELDVRAYEKAMDVNGTKFDDMRSAVNLAKLSTLKEPNPVVTGCADFDGHPANPTHLCSPLCGNFQEEPIIYLLHTMKRTKFFGDECWSRKDVYDNLREKLRYHFPKKAQENFGAVLHLMRNFLFVDPESLMCSCSSKSVKSVPTLRFSMREIEIFLCCTLKRKGPSVCHRLMAYRSLEGVGLAYAAISKMDVVDVVGEQHIRLVGLTGEEQYKKSVCERVNLMLQAAGFSADPDPPGDADGVAGGVAVVEEAERGVTSGGEEDEDEDEVVEVDVGADDAVAHADDAAYAALDPPSEVAPAVRSPAAASPFDEVAIREGHFAQGCVRSRRPAPWREKGRSERRGRCFLARGDPDGTTDAAFRSLVKGLQNSAIEGAMPQASRQLLLDTFGVLAWAIFWGHTDVPSPRAGPGGSTFAHAVAVKLNDPAIQHAFKHNLSRLLAAAPQGEAWLRVGDWDLEESLKDWDLRSRKIRPTSGEQRRNLAALGFKF